MGGEGGSTWEGGGYMGGGDTINMMALLLATAVLTSNP